VKLSFLTVGLVVATFSFGIFSGCSQPAKKTAENVRVLKNGKRIAIKKVDTGRRISSLKPAKKYVHSLTPPTGIAPRGIDYEMVLSDIAFGSWINQNLPQHLWNPIAESNPQLFLFLGDTIKLEDRSFAEQYAKLNLNPEYKSLREKVPFLAIWNAQDYKVDTGQREFVQQWSYLQDSINLGQTGLFHAKMIGPAKKQVQIILLDTRSFRGPRLAGDKPNAPVLGDQQWRWLEDQLARPAEIKFIVSTIPVIPARQDGESWNNYPVERQRLFDLIKKLKPKNLAIVSGGARQGSISKTNLKDWGPLYDITTGPMNDPGDRPLEADERFAGPSTIAENFGVAQIDWSNRLLVLKLLNTERTILNSASIKIR
jgi:alkaline phosphatase D